MGIAATLMYRRQRRRLNRQLTAQRRRQQQAHFFEHQVKDLKKILARTSPRLAVKAFRPSPLCGGQVATKTSLRVARS